MQPPTTPAADPATRVPSLRLRPVQPEDLPFLRRVYAGTRAEEMALVPWPEAQKAAFLAMQFDAQRRYYEQQFPHARFSVVLRDGQPAGRLYVDHREREIRVIDIALLPEHRGAGLGTALMREILDHAAHTGRAVRIHVEQNNPALRLYRRLGFTKLETQGVYHLMEWSGAAAGT